MKEKNRMEQLEELIGLAIEIKDSQLQQNKLMQLGIIKMILSIALFFLIFYLTTVLEHFLGFIQGGNYFVISTAFLLISCIVYFKCGFDICARAAEKLRAEEIALMNLKSVTLFVLEQIENSELKGTVKHAILQMQVYRLGITKKAIVESN